MFEHIIEFVHVDQGIWKPITLMGIFIGYQQCVKKVEVGPL